MSNYKVTKRFIGSILDGFTHTEETSVKFEIGFVCNKPCAGSQKYKIISVEEI